MRAVFDFLDMKVDLDAPFADRGVQYIHIGFREGGALPVHFEGLSFGWDLIFNDEVIDKRFYPESPDQHYVATYEDYCQIDAFIVHPDSEYSLRVWARDGNRELVEVKKFMTGPPLSMEEALQIIEPLDVEI
jgi:hypothetical protein